MTWNILEQNPCRKGYGDCAGLGFNFRSFSVGFVVDRVALGQVCFASSTFVLLS